MNRNRIPIVLPCHRVVGASGDLVGYAGGLDRKIKLLELDGTAERVVGTRTEVVDRVDEG
jgi:hypothetical protein